MTLPVFVYDSYAHPGTDVQAVPRPRLGRRARPDPDRDGAEPDRPPHRPHLRPQDRPLTTERSDMSKRIEVNDLNVYYGNFLAVEDVDHHHRAARGHRLHRPVRLRQVDLPAHAEPHARGHPRRPRRGRGAARRREPLRPRRRPGARAPPGRHGVPAAEPVPDDVDQRERARRRQAEQQAHAPSPSRRRSSSSRCAAPTSGTRSRTASTSPARASPAASSSASASPARSRWRPRCC